MKKIICLVDYTPASENALQYASRLAHDISAKLILTTLQTHKASTKALALAGEDDAFYNSSRLSEMCDRVRSVWKVPCGYRETMDVENETDLPEQNVHLLIMGIKSSVKSTPHLLSSDIDFKMIRKSRVPVLLVPDNFQYRKAERVLYAYDYANEPVPPLNQLKEIAEWLKTDVQFLAVVEKEYSRDLEYLLDERCDGIIPQWKSDRKLTFEYIYYSNVKKCIDNYLDLWKSDDIVIFSIDHPTLLHRLFHKSIIREMTVCSRYPMLIIHK